MDSLTDVSESRRSLEEAPLLGVNAPPFCGNRPLHNPIENPACGPNLMALPMKPLPIFLSCLLAFPCFAAEEDSAKKKAEAAASEDAFKEVPKSEEKTSGHVYASPFKEWKEMILTNVYGCALTIRATMPALRESKGHLVLTSSVAGRRALPGSIYSASKHAVTAMGEAARLDYNDSGVRVTLIEPGLVYTPIFDEPPRIEPLQADDVARAVMFAVSQPRHVDVNEILIRPTAQPG